MNVKLSYTLDFSAIVSNHDRLLPNRYTMEVNIITATENNNYQNIAFQRILFFVREIFEDSIFINAENPILSKIADVFGSNHLVLLPDDPDEQIIGIMLFHKFSAITEGNFEIESVIIGSELTDNLMYTVDDFSDFPQYSLITDERPIPWWNRSDISTADINQISEEITWEDIDLNWDRIEESESIDSNIENELEIIVDCEEQKSNSKFFVLEGGAKIIPVEKDK